MTSRFLSLLAFPCLASGCVFGDLDTPHVDVGVTCVDQATIIAADQLSKLGFSADDILAIAAGSHQSSIHWGTTFEGVTVGPETGEGSLTIDIVHDGGEIRFVDSEPEFGTDEGGNQACRDRLEVEVTVSVKTDGGALDESAPGILVADTDRYATIDLELALDTLSGSLQVASEDPDDDVGPVTVEIGVSEFGLFGSLFGTLSSESGDAVSVGGLRLATFPDANPKCERGEIPVPADAAFDQFTLMDVLALVNADWTYEMSWEDVSGPSPMQMSVVHDGSSGCVAIDSEVGTGNLYFGGTVTLTTEDGVDASFPVRIEGQPDTDGTLLMASVHTYASYGSSVPVSEFASTYGTFPAADLSGYDKASLEFSGSFADSELPGSADGSLTVLGVHTGACSDQPGEPCMGDDIWDAARATWGNTGG